MNVFRNLFAKSPFEPLQSHMEKVAICVNKVTNLFEAYYQRDFKKLKKWRRKFQNWNTRRI